MQETEETQAPSLSWEDPLGSAWQPTPVFLPGESHGQRSLVGYGPQGCKELDTTEATEHTKHPGFWLMLDIDCGAINWLARHLRIKIFVGNVSSSV